MDLGCVDVGQGSYGITQGNIGSTGRKKGKTKNSSEGEERKKKKGNVSKSHMHRDSSGGYGVHEYSVENPAVSSSTEPGLCVQQGHQAPKPAFKKAHHKSLDKVGQGTSKSGLLEQESLDLMQNNEAKVESTSSNYDDAMQFLKKRRYLQVAHNANASGPAAPGGAGSEYDVSVNMSDLQGSASNVMDADVPLSFDKSGIPDEVLQSLLEHYAQKPDSLHHDIHFDLSDQHLELNPTSADAPSPSGDRMHEYSRFLLQALERTSHSAAFPLGPGLPPSGPFTNSHLGNLLYADKNIYTTSPLDCFGQSVPKSHFAMLTSSSPQHSFSLSTLEAPTHQQLTPSQELTEQMEKRHSSTPPSSYQISPSDLSLQKDQPSVKTGTETIYSQDLASLDSSKPSYHIENFAQAFGSQFKSDGHGLSYGTDSGGEVDHRIRTPVSDFSGFSSLLSDVNEPGSTGPKTPTSQSYR